MITTYLSRLLVFLMFACKAFAFTTIFFVTFGGLLGIYLPLWDFRGLFCRGAGMLGFDKEQGFTGVWDIVKCLTLFGKRRK